MTADVFRIDDYSENRMKTPPVRRGKPHKHIAVTTYVLHQVDGLPYETERSVCSECGRVLGDRRLRRAAA